jgi:hypothetical protein
MEPPVTESEWLIDAADPLLDDSHLARVADARRPDRLAWNTFRTLALWNTDAWVPALLEIALGEENRLTPLEWADTNVVPWGAGVPGDDVCDVVLDGPEAYVVVVCSLSDQVPPEALAAGAIDALDGSLQGAREAGVVVVTPTVVDDLDERLRAATEVELHDGRLASELLDGAMGGATWPDLGRLALDLAEEGDPDVAPVEQVRQLVLEIEAAAPAEPL